MILYDKIKAKYSKEEIIKFLGGPTGRRLWREELNIHPGYISSRIELKELNYTIDDFFKDYSKSYSHYKEKKMTYNMVMKGYSIYKLRNEFKLESQFNNLIIKGFNYNSITLNVYKVFNVLGIEVDLSHFTVDLYKTHIELFGEKEDLEKFKDRYGIKWELWYEPYRKSWHLAFNGCLAEYIRSKKAG